MKHLNLFFFFFIVQVNFAQSIVKGKIVDDRNARLLNDVEISVYDMNDDGLVATALSDHQGQFILLVNKPGDYVLRLMRQAYYDVELFIKVSDQGEDMKIKMSRLPGYEFEGTIKELLSYSTGKIGKKLEDVKIEIYNNTTSKEIVVNENEAGMSFSTIFERGNQYTMLFRKKGFFAKRITVFVDVEGCILCFEGLGTYVSPEIESALTSNNERGSIISDIPMKKIIQDESIVLENIYYDFNKWNVRKDARPALEQLVNILKRNPIVIELSSHTDSRGKDDYNMELSQKRAQAVVDYIVSRGIKQSRITAKGYGETALVNDCDDEKVCDEIDHQKNRRTEFKVTSFIEASNFDAKSLKEIMEQERLIGKRMKESILILENN